jgi:hypothetical protein
VQQPAPSPRQFNQAVPEYLEAVCLRCLEKDPARRYQSAEELGRSLAPCAAAELGGGTTPPVMPRLPAPEALLAPVTLPRSVTAPASAPAPAPAPPPLAPAGNGRRLLVTLAMLVMLGGGAAALAFNNWRPDTTTNAAAPPPPRPAAAKVEPPVKGEDGKVDPETVAWLREMEKGDAMRGIEVEMLDSKADEDGVHRLRPLQPVRLRVRSKDGGRLIVWAVGPKGTLTRLDDKGADQVQAGKWLTIPESGKQILAGQADGREHVLVLRTDHQGDLESGDKEGPFFVLRTLDKIQKLRKDTRELIRLPGFSSKVIPFEVVRK